VAAFLMKDQIGKLEAVDCQRLGASGHENITADISG